MGVGYELIFWKRPQSDFVISQMAGQVPWPRSSHGTAEGSAAPGPQGSWFRMQTMATLPLACCIRISAESQEPLDLCNHQQF